MYPSRFASITRRFASGGTSSRRPTAASTALLTQTSILPKCSTPAAPAPRRSPTPRRPSAPQGPSRPGPRTRRRPRPAPPPSGPQVPPKRRARRSASPSPGRCRAMRRDHHNHTIGLVRIYAPPGRRHVRSYTIARLAHAGVRRYRPSRKAAGGSLGSCPRLRPLLCSQIPSRLDSSAPFSRPRPTP
jgi:hypothetical protein